MAFTVNDLQDLIALLAAKPEWRAQLRPLILGDQFDRLPEIVERLAEAQERTEARIEQLFEAQQRTEKALDSLTREVALLTLAFKEFGRQYEDDSGALYEVRFERKAPSLFGEWLRKPRAITINDLEKIDDAEVSGELSEPEARQLRALDVIIIGLDRSEPGYPETVLAVEVSRTIEFNDLDRAATRAAILNRLGYRALAAVGGRFVSKEVEAEAKERGILLRLVDQVG